MHKIPPQIFKAYDIRGVVGKTLDSEIVKAIEENRLEEELEKHFPAEVLHTRRNSNFIELIDEDDLDEVPEEFEPIPDKF